MKRVHRPWALPFPVRQAGFTLLEVLVAIVVLSFGVLGMVGLQAAALQSNKEARYQSAAVRLGRELADMMRGNKDIAIKTSDNPYLIDYPATKPSSTVSCFTARCASTKDVADFHVREWLERLEAELPGARVLVCFDKTPYVEATGVPQWDCSGDGGVSVLKISWSRRKIDSTEGSVQGGSAAPLVVLPLIAGSVE